MKQIELGDEKLTYGAFRLNKILSNLQASTQPHLDIKSFISFIDNAPVTLIKYFLDILELRNMWEDLFKSHSAIFLGWQMMPLPKFPIFSQLMGLYRYVIAYHTKDEDSQLQMLEQAVKEGSVNALIFAGDIYINKILSKSEIDLSKLLKQVESFAKLFLTPGHIIAADIFLAAWATTLDLEHSARAFYHLGLAEMLLKSSNEYIHNAYGLDFKSALEQGEVFRGEEFKGKGQSISKYISTNWATVKGKTSQEINLSPIIRKASFDFKETKSPTKKLKMKIQVNDLQEFFFAKLKADPCPAESVLSYVINSNTPLLGLRLFDTATDTATDTETEKGPPQPNGSQTTKSLYSS